MSFKHVMGLVTMSSLSATLCFGSLQLIEFQAAAGQGLGAVATVLTVGDNTSKLVGCFGLADNTTSQTGATFSSTGTGCTGDGGDVKEQSFVRAFNDPGLLFTENSASNSIGVVYNSSQTGGDPITLFDLVLRIYDEDGNVLFTSQGLKDTDGNLVGTGGLTLDPDANGVGGSGFLFQLDAEQQALAKAAFGPDGFNNGNRFAVSVDTGCSPATDTCFGNTGGLETVKIVNLNLPPPPDDTAVPEPATLGLMGAALVGLGIYHKRRRIA